MVSVKVKLRRSSVQNKMGKLFIQLIYNREIKIISTPFKLLPDEWNEKEQQVVPDVKHMVRAMELCVIEKDLGHILETLDGIILKLSRRNNFTVNDIVERFSGKNSKNMLFSFMRKCIKELVISGKQSTALKYKGAFSQFYAYRKGVDLTFEQMDEEELKRYEKFLIAKGMTMNSVSFYLRIMRAVYYRAVVAGVAPDFKPFRSVYTGVAKTVKRAVDGSVIKKLEAAKLQPKLAFARDMFLLSFYMRGMAYVDMSKLKKSDCTNFLLKYNRSKTGQTIVIRLESCMNEIIKRYAKECRSSENLLPIITCEKETIKYATALRTYNHRLKVISEQLNIEPHLTSYVSRHTWASQARIKGINLSIISEGMGHTSEKTTQIYLSSLDHTILDDANKLIIG